jgi:hypothetical protein
MKMDELDSELIHGICTIALSSKNLVSTGADKESICKLTMPHHSRSNLKVLFIRRLSLTCFSLRVIEHHTHPLGQKQHSMSPFSYPSINLQTHKSSPFKEQGIYHSRTLLDVFLTSCNRTSYPSNSLATNSPPDAGLP